jgi:hypothetical protein
MNLVKQVMLAGMLVVMLAACSGEQKKPVMIVFHEGNEYSIVDRGDMTIDEEQIYFVRYISTDPANDSVRSRECADLYAIIAKHIDTNTHQRVIITAVDHQGRLFGLIKPREVVESKSAAEVLADHAPVDE